MKWTMGRVLLAVVFFTILPFQLCIASDLTERAAGSEGSNTECEAIVGTWLWMNGAEVRCFVDGSCTASNGFEGRWQCLDTAGRVEIRWARPGQAPQYTDTVDLLAGGGRLAGRNQFGGGVTATRVRPASGQGAGCTSLIGTWRWHNGATIICMQDGICTASNGFSAGWTCLDAAGRFEIRWARPGQPPQFVDSVEISADGRRLSGRNQYGVGVGAERVVAVGDAGEMGIRDRVPAGETLGDETGRLDDYEPFDETSSFSSCTPRIMNTSLGVETGVEVRVEVFGLENGRCHFHQTVIADEHGLGLSGMDMTCRLPLDDSSKSLVDFCEGSLVTAYLELVEGS